MLDIAPSAALSRHIRRKYRIRYRTADLYMKNVDDRVDVTSMACYPDGNFGGLICSHVLEHVEDDKKAKAVGQIVPVRKEKLPALRVLLALKDARTGEKMLQDLVIAVFKQREGFNAVYFIALQTPELQHEKYIHIIDDLQKDFKVFKMYS